MIRIFLHSFMLTLLFGFPSCRTGSEDSTSSPWVTDQLRLSDVDRIFVESIRDLEKSINSTHGLTAEGEEEDTTKLGDLEIEAKPADLLKMGGRIAELKKTSSNGICSSLRPLGRAIHTYKHWYYFMGVFGQAGVVGARNVGVDMVWDIYNQEFGSFYYTGTAISGSIGIDAGGQIGFAVGKKDSLIEAWSGWFGTGAAALPFSQGPFKGFPWLKNFTSFIGPNISSFGSVRFIDVNTRVGAVKTPIPDGQFIGVTAGKSLLSSGTSLVKLLQLKPDKLDQIVTSSSVAASYYKTFNDLTRLLYKIENGVATIMRTFGMQAKVTLDRVLVDGQEGLYIRYTADPKRNSKKLRAMQVAISTGIYTSMVALPVWPVIASAAVAVGILRDLQENPGWKGLPCDYTFIE